MIISRFAVKHFADYLPTANVIVGGDALQLVENVDAEKCTAKCSVKPDCRSVNYCYQSAKTPDATCQLMKFSPSDKDVPKSRHPGCWNYRKQSGVSLPYHPPPPPGYTGGRLTGLVIGMIITGMVLGVVAVLAYGHYKSRSEQSSGRLGLSIPSVRWSRQNNDE